MRIQEGTAKMEQDYGGNFKTGQRQKVNSKNPLFDREREKEIISGKKRKTRARVGGIVGIENKTKSSISVSFF